MEQQAQAGASKSENLTKHRGSCHCGSVRYEVEIDLQKGGSRCNCSVCTKTSVTAGIVKPARFTLLCAERELGEYEWGAKHSKRFFCKNCGVHCFGRGHLAEVGGDYVAVNLNTLDDVELDEVSLVHWDGRHDNWEAGPRPSPWPIMTSSAVAS
jgi:hypothetical protein